MRRAAVCISGHLRQFQVGFDLFNENIMKPNPTWAFDFFIETWAHQDWRTQEKFQSTHDIVGLVSDTYKPKALCIEPEIEWDTSPYMQFVKNPRWVKKGYGGVRSKGEHILAMYYKILRANELKSKFEEAHNFKYDTVIRHRTDFVLSQKLILNQHTPDLASKVYVPFCDQGAREGGISIRDMFAISSSENMDYYSGLFSCMDNIVEASGVFRPEPMLYFYLNQNKNIDVVELHHPWRILAD